MTEVEKILTAINKLSESDYDAVLYDVMCKFIDTKSKELDEDFDDIEIKADKDTQSISVFVDSEDGLEFIEEIDIYK